jgi:hypothetical protein
MAEGWTYRPARDDAAKKRLDLGPAAAHVMAIRDVAGEAEELMLGENRDWFVVMRFDDFALHA